MNENASTPASPPRTVSPADIHRGDTINETLARIAGIALAIERESPRYDPAAMIPLAANLEEECARLMVLAGRLRRIVAARDEIQRT